VGVMGSFCIHSQHLYPMREARGDVLSIHHSKFLRVFRLWKRTTRRRQKKQATWGGLFAFTFSLSCFSPFLSAFSLSHFIIRHSCFDFKAWPHLPRCSFFFLRKVARIMELFFLDFISGSFMRKGENGDWRMGWRWWVWWVGVWGNAYLREESGLYP
jgi:hypothetical protein